MSKDIERTEKYEKKFAELDVQELGLLEGERIKHCNDAEAFDEKLFVPEWAITNEGRGYSLWGNIWLAPQATGSRDYWHFVGSKQPAVHELVAYYFRDESDVIALEEFGEDSVEVQHEIPIEIPEELKHGTTENREARIKHCMECNCKRNVYYQKKEHNRSKDRRITNGCETEEEQKGIEIWSADMKAVRSMFAGSGKLTGNRNGARVIYSKDENGKLKESINMILKLKGSFLEKDTVVIREFKVNGGVENKEFIENNAEEIYEAIKQRPTKNKLFRQYVVVDGRWIYYALN